MISTTHRPHYDQPGTVSQRFYPDYDHGDERRFYICRERPDINVVVLTGAGDTPFAREAI